MLRAVLLALASLAAVPAQAYCIHNQLGDRAIVVEQEPHEDRLRDERRFRHTIAPGRRQCCAFHNLDCNPGGRKESIVSLAITIPGEPAYHCGFPAGEEPNVKVTGGGGARVMRNPRHPKGSATPYIIRIRTHDKDITGPRGLACPQPPSKGTP